MIRQLAYTFLTTSIMLITATWTVAGEQTVCPVMEGNPIDKQIFLDYQGKRVYFCCASCKAQFLKDPEKYIVKLPQFTPHVAHSEGIHAGHVHSNGHFSTANFIVPLGISTFVLMIATFLAGFFMKKSRKILFPWHRRLGVLTLLMAVSHVISVILAH